MACQSANAGQNRPAVDLVTLRQIQLLSQKSFRGEMDSRSTRCLTTVWKRREHPSSLELVVMDSRTVRQCNAWRQFPASLRRDTPMAEANSATSMRTSRVIKVPREALYRAFTDPAALAIWLKPGEMTGKVHEFDFTSRFVEFMFRACY